MSQLIKKRFPSITSIDVGTDGNTSFLRAARNGQLEKVLEHLESNIDINTSNANGLNALHLASKDGHVEIVEELLKRGAVIDAATKKGNTALHIASLAGQEEVVKLLVTHGASVNVQSQNGFTPLYMAAQENHDNVVKYLLANGANQSLSTEDGFTPLAVAMQQGHDKVVTVLLENDTRGKVRLPALHIAAKKDDVKAAKLLLENEHNPDVTSKSGFTPLHIASHYGNQSIANLLVQKGADVNYSAKHNITPLHVAAKWGKTNMVTVLLEQGANIESKTRDGLTPLHCAARSGHEQVVDMLLEKGAPISSKTKNGLAPLHMAAQGDHVDAARILLYHRAPVDEVTVDYLTALHVAAHCGHVRVAKLLLDRQADANARALNGFTPLHIACKKNRIKVVELLIKHRANIGATTESGLTPLHVASFMGCMNIVIYLLQHEADPDVPTVRGETPLHLAARANQTDIIRILLRNGAQVDARAREQQTPLHIASRLGNVDIVMLLLQHGAQVDNTTKDMYTALHIAAKEGQDEVAAALIDNGASLNATTKKGFTPLHLAAKYGHLKVAKLLLQKEAPVDAQGKNGVTPLHVASHYDHQNVALLLLEKGASPYATAKNGHTPLHIAAKKNQMDIANTLLEYGAKPNAESKAGFTPLHLSAQEGHCDMTDLLIEHQADTNHTARNGLTPLHLCAQEDKVSVAEILVKNGGEVDGATKNGYTPLHIACHYGQINMVRFLLAHGANVKATTSLGYTPLHQAAQQGHTNIVNTLLENSAAPNAVTNNGQTPLHIAEKLGYITVIDTLKVVTQPSSPMSASPISNDEKYRVVAPEAMHETFMSDSEEEGGEDTVLGDQTYRYLTADEMKSLGDDSLPIDVTRDERIDSNKMIANAENMLPPRHIEDNISPEHVQQNYVEYIKKYTPDNVDIDKHPISIGFLVSFLVDARGGAMRGCRHSGVRVIVPPRCASSPTRITCRYVRPQRTPHPPPLMEGEALASRVLELGPVGAKFLGPVIIEVPHFAALRGKEREIVILRSDNGESWKEHTVEATEDVLNEVFHDSFEAEDLNQLEDISSGRITRIVTQDFPQYFAVVSRIRQEVHAIGPEGGMVSSTVVPQVQAVFPQGALTKKIKVGLQAQPIDPELTAKLLGHGVAVSPVVTVEPRRRKFHKAITLSMPAPRAHSQGMINQYSGNAPTLRLLCSITGGTTRAQWEDVTGSTPLTFVNDCVSFTTTVSARFWLMDCRNVGDATKMATELYREAIHVPFMAKFVVFAKRVDPLEARLRVFCMTDDKEDKTLEHQEHFTEVAKSRDVEVLEGKPQYIEFAGNLVPITKSGEQLQFSFRAFRENRLPFSVKVKDQHAEAVSRCLFMREPKLPKGEPPQQPICILNIVLPDDIVVDTISLTDSDSVKRIENFDYYRPDPRLADMSNLLGDDWVPLAAQLGLTTSEINVIKSEYPDSVAKQAQSMLRMWLSQSGNKAQTNTLESALRRIEREDIIPQCLNVDYPPHGIKEIGKQRLIKKLEENLYEKDIMRDSESVESLKKSEEEKKKENFDKYSAEEKIVEETSEEEEDFNKTVTERRHQIEERLSVDRTVPASSQRVEIVQEISSIKRQSLVENKIAVVELKAVGEVVDEPKTTLTSNELTISPVAEKVTVDGDRRDSELLEGVTHRLEQKMVKKIASTEDPKSPKVSKTPPPSPADFITKEQAAAIQEWDVSKKSAPKEEEAPLPQDAEQQGLSTTTERIVASNEETLLDKPLGQQLTGLSVIDDYLVTDLKTVCEQTNAFIQSESQPEPYDALADKYSKKEPVNEKKVDDNKNNMNEKKKAKKGFFGSIKTFVERSFESDSESEKSPKKSKKPKKEKKKKSKEDTAVGEHALPPRKPKLPTPPLEPSDIDSIPYAEASVSDLPPPYKPPDVPSKEEQIPVTDLDADLEVKHAEVEKKTIPGDKESAKVSKPTTDEKDRAKSKTKEKPKEKDKKKIKGKTIIVEEVTKTIEPFVIEAEEFSIVVDPTKKESPKKSKETFTINIDESIEKKEKEILEKSPILPEEKIVKPIAALEMQPDVPVRPPRAKDHIYEDIEEPVVTIPQDRIKDITTDLIQNEINFGGWSDVLVADKVDRDDEPQKEIVEKHDKEVLKEKDVKDKSEEGEVKKKEEKKGGFFGLFKKKDSKKEEEAPPAEKEEKIEKDKKPEVSEATLKDMTDTQQFLLDEVQNYHDVQLVTSTPAETVTTAAVTSVPVSEEKIDEPKLQEPKTQSESFFGLFKKQKKDEKPFVDKKSEVTEKKSKKDDKKGEEKKVALVLSEEVLKNILDSKRFLEGEVQNYHDVRHEQTQIEDKVEARLDLARESLPHKELVDDSLPTKSSKELEPVPKKDLEDKKERSPKITTDDIKEPSPKKSVDEKREPSPKPSPGFFGLFKKSKKDEPDTAGDKIELSEETIKEMTETDQFLVAEVENYHDVREVQEKIVEETVESVKVVAETEETQSGGFFGLFKKSKKEEETQPSKITLSEATVKDMTDTNAFLTDEVANYHDVRLVPEKVMEEEKVTESAEQPSSGFFGLFKKTKKEDEKIVAEIKKEDVEPLISSIVAEEKLDVKIEDKTKKAMEEVRESSPKPPSGFFGLFKKSKKDEEEIVPSKPSLSDSVVKDMDDTKQFLSTEVGNFDDVKPSKFEQIVVEKASTAIESSPKPLRGVFDIFKKSKQDTIESEPLISETVAKEIKDSEELIKGEMEKSHDKIAAEPEKITKAVDEGVESSPKTSRGLFGIFKKTKKDSEDAPDTKPVISEVVLQAMNDTKLFLTGEVDKYHDVRPEKFERIEEDKNVKIAEEVAESSPKPSRGLFGIFKKSKKDQEETFDTVPVLCESVEKDMADTDTFLTVEVEHYDDVKPIKEETITIIEDTVAQTPKASKGLFSMFKKPKKDEEDSSGLAVSETIVQEMEDTKQFSTSEIDNYQDVNKPENTSEDEKLIKVSQEEVESSPKPSRGLFGIFKSPKKDKEEPAEAKTILSEEVQRNIADTDRFLTEEVEKYHDVKVLEEEKVSRAPETKEPSTKETSGMLDIFKITKNEEVEVVDVAKPHIEAVQKVTDETKEAVMNAAEMIDDVKPAVTEEVISQLTTTKTEVQDIEPRPEVRGGFLFKFKKTKKKPSLADTQLSEEVQKSVDETKSYLSTELKNYEDSKVEIPTEYKKEEKTVTFEATKSKMVLEGHLPQPEVAQVVEVIKAEVTDVAKEVDEEVKEVQDVVLQEANQIQHVTEPQDTSSKKEKQTKDKKGFFHRFGKKTKSQETSFDEVRGRSIDESEGSPKKQKRRKSSSPFKFFDKMKKSEEDVKEVEPSVEVKVEDVTKEDVKEDLLAVEFEEEPAMDLSKEVLGSLDKKMEALKSKYTPEVQKQINDCRDFLFIEVDNYEDAKPVVVTDIDTGLSTDALKTVDDIIKTAAKVVEDSKNQGDAAKLEATDSAEKVASHVEESARKTTKKAEKKSGGFFSKLGNLISGSVDEAKSELKEAKKSAEKVADKGKQSAEKSVDSAVKTVDSGVQKVKETAQDAQQVVSDKMSETKESAKELQESTLQTTKEKIDEVVAVTDSVTEKTAKKIDETKQDVMALKESLLEVTAKAGQKIDHRKKDTAVKAEAAVGEIKLVKDVSAAKADGIKKDIKVTMDTSKADMQKSAQELQDLTRTKIDELGQTKVSVESKVGDTLKTAIEESGKKFEDLKQGGNEVLSEKVADLEKSKLDATEEITKKGSDTKKELQAAVEEGKGTVGGTLGKFFDSTAHKIEEVGKVKDESVKTVTKKIEEVKEETESKAQLFSDTAAAKLEQAASTAKYTAVTKTSNIVDDTDKYVQDIISQAEAKTQETIDSAKAKADDLTKTRDKITGDLQTSATQKISDVVSTGKSFQTTAAQKIDSISNTATEKVEHLSNVKETVEQSLGEIKGGLQGAIEKKAEQIKQVKANVESNLATKIDDISTTSSQKVEDLRKIGQDIADSGAKKINELQKAGESVEKAALEKVDQQRKSLTGKCEDIGQIIQSSVHEKVDEMKKTKDKVASGVAAKVEDASKAAAQKIDSFEKAKQGIVDNATDKVNLIEKSGEEAKQTVVEKLDQQEKVIAQKRADVVQMKDDINDVSERKLAQLSKITAEKIEDVTHGKKQVEDFIARETSEPINAKDDIKKAATDKVAGATKVATEQIDQSIKIKETVKESGAQKIDDLTKMTSDKIQDFTKVKTTAEAEAAQVTGNFIAAVSKKLDETEEKIKKDTSKKVEQVDKVLTGKIEDISKTKDVLEQKIGTVKDAACCEVEYISKTASKKVEDLIEVKKSTEKSLKQDSADVLDNLSKKKDRIIDETVKTKTEVTRGLKGTVDQKIGNFTSISEGVSKQSNNLVQEVSEKITDVKDGAKKADDISKTSAGKLEDLITKGGSFVTSTAKKSEDMTTKKTEEALTTAKEFSEAKVEDLKETKFMDGAILEQKIDDTAKIKKSAVEDVTKIEETAKGTSVKIIEELSKKKKGAETTVTTVIEDKKKTAASEMMELDDKLAQLTSSLEQLTEPIIQEGEKVKSYVTSPTMARRAESQRISREERPTVREVRILQADNDSDEDKYTVTEPEEEQDKKRKPLFHLESEDDDAIDLTKTKDRRDSVRSNVLETLTENKLDNLLSDLEDQLVKDLERSVTEVNGKSEEKEKTESKLSKAECDLEEIKKDSQADVDQIEQKLRDLDKALDSLEQASDPKLEKKLHRVERKFERMASEAMDKDAAGVSPTQVEAHREHEFQKLVSQLSTEEVSDFQRDYSHLWDETTFSKSDDWDSKTPDSQVDVQELPQETTCAPTLTEEIKTIPQPKPRFAKETPPLQFKESRQPKLEKQISPVRDDLLDDDEAALETYSDKKKFWENVTKDKRMSLIEEPVHEKDTLKKRVSVHEVPIPKPRSQVQVASIDEAAPSKEDEEPDTKIMSEYQASFQPPSERKSKTPPKVESDKESTDSESENAALSGTNENAGYISDSGDVEHYISDSEIEDRVPQIRERQMSVFAAPVAAARKTIYERSASLPTEDMYEVSARSIKLRKQYYEEQIKKEMIEEQLTSEIEEEPSPERKTLIDSFVRQISEEKVVVRDIARSFDEATKKEVSFEDDRPTHKPEKTTTHIEDQTPISQQFQETHKEIDVDAQTKRSSLGSEQSSSSDIDRVTRNGSTSKPDSMEVHVDKSEIEDSEKLADLDQDGTDLETKSLDSLNAVEMSPKSMTFVDEAIPEITVTLSGTQRRISEESDEYAPKPDKKTELDSPIHVPEEHVEDTVWEVSVQSQPEAHFDEKVTSFDAATVEKIEKDDDLSLSTRDESDMGSEIHQDHSDSYASDKIKSESHSDIERIIMDSLQHQKVDPVEAKAIASALIEEIEAEIQRRECSPPTTTTGDVSDYLKYLAETKGLDEREVELVESVLARRQRELVKLSRGDTQTSSIEITDEDLRYSGNEGDMSHILEQQISQLKAEKLDDIKSMTLLDKIEEKHTEETHLSKDYETYENGITTGVKSEVHTKTFESIKGEKSEAKDTIFEEDETISESATHESEELETRVEAVTSEILHKRLDDKEVDESRETSVDVSKEKTSDVTTKTADTEGEDIHQRTTQDASHESDVTKSIIKHHVDMTEKSPTEERKLKGEITCEDYLSKEESTKKETTSEIKEVDGIAVEKEEAVEKSHTKTIQKEVFDKATEETRTHKGEDSVVTESKISSKVISRDVIRESSTVTEVKEKIEVVDIEPSLLPTELDEVKTVTDKHEEIKRTSSSESKSSIESGKSPEDQFSTCSSGRKGDSDSSKIVEKPEVLMRKTSTLQKADRKSGIDFEAYSSSGESHYHSFELDSGKSRPCSSDVEGLVAAGSSEYESALTSQDYSTRSHITSTEYHTAASSLSSKESMKSLDSESSGHLGSVEVSELSETLVPSASDAEGDILDAVDQLDDGPWNEDIMDDLADTQTKMKRSHEMTFQPEPKILAAESPQADEMDRKFTSMDDGSIVSMSLSSTSGTTEPRTVIELSRADSDRLEGGSMSVSGISDQLSIEGSCDSLVFHPTAPLGTTDMSTSTAQIEGNLQIESITFTTSIVNESGIRSVSTQVTSESRTPEEDRVTKIEETQMNGKCPPETKKKTHRRQESTSSFVPPVLSSFDQKFHSDLTESDKYTAELSFKEVISDEKKDIDEREREESYETEADQGFHRDIREGKYHETEEEIKDDTPEFSSETQASVGELEQEYTSALARTQEGKKKSETSPDLHLHKEQLEKRDSHGKSSSTSSEKSSFEEAEAEAAFNMVAHVSPAHKIKQICPILEDEDAEKHELETRERAQKEYEKRRSQIRDQSPGSIPDIKVTQHMTPLVDRNFRYPDLELEEQERAKEKEKEKESEAQKSTPQTPSSKSSEDTDQGREYVLEDSGISIPEEAATESKSTVIEQTVKEEADKDTDSPNSDSFEMLEKPDLIDDFVVIEEVAKEAQEFDSEGKSVSIQKKSKQKQKAKKHDEEVEAYLTRSAPTPLTRMTDVKFYPDGSSSEELGFDFEDSPPINNEATASSYEKELEANKKWIEQQFQGDQAARLAAGYDYEMEFERGPLEDIKEEDINDFDPTSSRIGSLGSQKESGGSLGSVKDSYSSTPEYDVLAGRKYFTRSGEHDDISMSSLQEFENLERAMSLETKRYHQGSQDSSSNGSFKTRYYASKSGQGDDVSVSSLKEFEGLEMACIAAHKVETKAKEEEAMLAQIDEGQESIASESESCETVSRTDKKIIPDSDEEDYEKRMFEIDEIIRQAQSNVERFIDLKEADKTESLGRGDSIEEVSKVPDLDLDTPLVRTTVKVQLKENEDVMVTSTDSIDGKEEKESQHSSDSLDQKTCADIMTASTDSIEFQAKKTEAEPINLLSDSIEIKDERDEACGMISSDSLELATKHSETMLESTDSLVDPTSSTATHATYQYETDSVFSGSFTSGGSNTMVSSTDTIDPVQVDIGAAARKVWFDEDAGSSRKFTTEYIQDTGKPYVTEVIEPSEDDGFSHTVHRRVELPPEVRKVTFYGSDADEKLKQFIEDFNEGEHVEEVQEVDADGNVHTRRVVQKRFIIRGEEGPDMEEFIKKTVASKTNQLTSFPKETTGEESSLAATGGPSDSALKAQGSRRRQLRYEISVDDQIEVDPREHDWRFNLPKHAEGEESTAGDQQPDSTSSQQRSVTDQHQLSEEMKQLLQELEKESKQ